MVALFTKEYHSSRAHTTDQETMVRGFFPKYKMIKSKIRVNKNQK